MQLITEEFNQIYPRSGWVEHDPIEIWSTQIEVVREAMEKLHWGRPSRLDWYCKSKRNNNMLG